VDWSKVTAIVCVLSVAVLLVMLYMPDSVYGKVAAVALGLSILYLGFHVAARGRSAIPGEEPGVTRAKESTGRPAIDRGVLSGPGRDTPLDNDLIARIFDNLKSDPSEHLREMLAAPSGDRWSPEALQAARLLLDQRLTKTAPEPVYRTTPRAQEDQSSRVCEAVAAGFSRDLLSLDVGSRAYCRWRGEVGTIICWDDENERFFIRLDNGEWEWATLSMFH
jgi:hypothetical protein